MSEGLRDGPQSQMPLSLCMVLSTADSLVQGREFFQSPLVVSLKNKEKTELFAVFVFLHSSSGNQKNQDLK